MVGGLALELKKVVHQWSEQFILTRMAYLKNRSLSGFFVTIKIEKCAQDKVL
jgi:hypothetical protein